MKAAVFSIALALSAGAAFAEGPIQGNEVFNFQSTLSRAAVQTQVGYAARGEASEGQDQATIVASNASRALVKAEAAEAYRLNLVAHGEVLPVLTAERAVQSVKVAQN